MRQTGRRAEPKNLDAVERERERERAAFYRKW